MTDRELKDRILKIAKEDGYEGVLSPRSLDECAEVYAKFVDEDGAEKPRIWRAKNGKKSNLSRIQWLLVRTRSFRNWFGRSVVVDENGDPKVMYHGSAEQFDEFKTDAISVEKSKMTLWAGPGFYFSDKKKTAIIYGKKGGVVMEVFLRLENPLVVDETGNAEKYADHVTQKEAVEVMLDGDNTQWLDSTICGELVRMTGKSRQQFKAMSRKERVEAYVKELKTDVVKLKCVSSAFGAKSQKKMMNAICKHTGRDGVIHKIAPGVTEWVVYDPKAIKSATDNDGDFSRAKACVEDAAYLGEENTDLKGRKSMFSELIDALNKLKEAPAADHEVAQDIVDRHGRHHQPKAIPEGGQYEEEGQYLHGQAKVDAAMRKMAHGKHAAILRDHVAPMYAAMGKDSITRAKIQAMHEDIRGLSKNALLRGMSRHLKDAKKHAQAYEEVKDMDKEQFKNWLNAHPEYAHDINTKLLNESRYNGHREIKGGFHDDGTGHQKHEAWEEAKWSVGAKAMASMILFQEHADALSGAPDQIMANAIEHAMREQEGEVENHEPAPQQIVEAQPRGQVGPSDDDFRDAATRLRNGNSSSFNGDGSIEDVVADLKNVVSGEAAATGEEINEAVRILGENHPVSIALGGRQQAKPQEQPQPQVAAGENAPRFAEHGHVINALNNAVAKHERIKARNKLLTDNGFEVDGNSRSEEEIRARGVQFLKELAENPEKLAANIDAVRNVSKEQVEAAERWISNNSPNESWARVRILGDGSLKIQSRDDERGKNVIIGRDGTLQEIGQNGDEGVANAVREHGGLTTFRSQGHAIRLLKDGGQMTINDVLNSYGNLYGDEFDQEGGVHRIDIAPARSASEIAAQPVTTSVQPARSAEQPTARASSRPASERPWNDDGTPNMQHGAWSSWPNDTDIADAAARSGMSESEIREALSQRVSSDERNRDLEMRLENALGEGHIVTQAIVGNTIPDGFGQIGSYPQHIQTPGVTPAARRSEEGGLVNVPEHSSPTASQPPRATNPQHQPLVDALHNLANPETNRAEEGNSDIDYEDVARRYHEHIRTPNRPGEAESIRRFVEGAERGELDLRTNGAALHSYVERYAHDIIRAIGENHPVSRRLKAAIERKKAEREAHDQVVEHMLSEGGLRDGGHYGYQVHRIVSAIENNEATDEQIGTYGLAAADAYEAAGFPDVAARLREKVNSIRGVSGNQPTQPTNGDLPASGIERARSMHQRDPITQTQETATATTEPTEEQINQAVSALNNSVGVENGDNHRALIQRALQDPTGTGAPAVDYMRRHLGEEHPLVQMLNARVAASEPTPAPAQSAAPQSQLPDGLTDENVSDAVSRVMSTEAARERGTPSDVFERNLRSILSGERRFGNREQREQQMQIVNEALGADHPVTRALQAIHDRETANEGGTPSQSAAPANQEPQTPTTRPTDAQIDEIVNHVVQNGNGNINADVVRRIINDAANGEMANEIESVGFSSLSNFLDSYPNWINGLGDLPAFQALRNHVRSLEQSQQSATAQEPTPSQPAQPQTTTQQTTQEPAAPAQQVSTSSPTSTAVRRQQAELTSATPYRGNDGSNVSIPKFSDDDTEVNSSFRMPRRRDMGNGEMFVNPSEMRRPGYMNGLLSALNGQSKRFLRIAHPDLDVGEAMRRVLANPYDPRYKPLLDYVKNYTNRHRSASLNHFRAALNGLHDFYGFEDGDVSRRYYHTWRDHLGEGQFTPRREQNQTADMNDTEFGSAVDQIKAHPDYNRYDRSTLEGNLRRAMYSGDMTYISDYRKVFGEESRVVKQILRHASESARRQEEARAAARTARNWRPTIDEGERTKASNYARTHNIRISDTPVELKGEDRGYNCYLNDAALFLQYMFGAKVRPQARPSSYGSGNGAYFKRIKDAMRNSGWKPLEGASANETLENVRSLTKDGTWISFWNGGHNTSAVRVNGMWYKHDGWHGDTWTPTTAEAIASHLGQGPNSDAGSEWKSPSYAYIPGVSTVPEELFRQMEPSS